MQTNQSKPSGSGETERVSSRKLAHKNVFDAVFRFGTSPKYVLWKSRSPTYMGPSSSFRTLSTYLRYSDELAKLLLLRR